MISHLAFNYFTDRYKIYSENWITSAKFYIPCSDAKHCRRSFEKEPFLNCRVFQRRYMPRSVCSWRHQQLLITWWKILYLNRVTTEDLWSQNELFKSPSFTIHRAYFNKCCFVFDMKIHMLFFDQHIVKEIYVMNRSSIITTKKH